MDSSQRIKLNNNLSYFAIGILTSCFILTLALVILPQLPNYPNIPGERRLFVSSWNFACTLMWIMVLRIQVFNELSDSIERKEHRRGVTPWVKFWFAASILIGSMTIIYVLHSFAVEPSGSPIYMGALTILSVATWIMLVALSISLFLSRGKCSEEVLSDMKKALVVHRWVLAPSSLLFFLSTFLFPLFFLL